MTISELDDLALSRLIAEEIGYVYGVCGCCGALGTSHWHEPISMSECLCAVDADGNMIASKEHGASCQLPDFVTDPAMTMMLLEKLIQQGFKPAFIDLNSKETRLITATKNGKGNFADGVIGRAVAEAYALAHGLGEK